MKNTIEFNTNTTSQTAGSPWSSKNSGDFLELILKPDYESKRLRFSVRAGGNWFRIVPGMKASIHGWMMPLHVLSFPGGKVLHPKSLKKSTPSVFDYSYGWMKQHQPEALYSKTNRQGARLLTDPVTLCWVLVEEGGKTVARLLMASGYDGSRGGVPGLGYQIWQASKEMDETGSVVADAIAPEAGLRMCVEKTQPKGAKYPSYNLRVGRQPAPIDPMIAEMDPEEIKALIPLENVVREISEEGQWECLARCLPPSTVAEIRASFGK